ncbi:MAG TPA: chemotaxis protein CheA [Gemmatimonadales bacterium]|nr:chemotaxis protein CheA [Gemmatimonadales bacterium]
MSHDHAFGELIQEYIAECLPLAEAVNDACLGLERRWAAGDLDAGAVTGLKGTLHTLKGNSAMMGFRPMQVVAHALEDLAARVAKDSVGRGEVEAGLLVEGSGLLVDLIRAAADPEGGGPAADAFVERVRSRLESAVSSTQTTPLRLDRRRTERRTENGIDGGTVRVDFRRLDNLLEIFGEAMIEQSALADVYRRLAARLGSSPELTDLDRVVVALGATMKRLETALMQTRLLPLSTVFGRFTRSVRDLARDQRKKVRLVIEGGDTLLDKTILDRLGEPLVHLVSNAVVHGVESESERARVGKAPEATVGLRAVALADRVSITVSDDGRGLDATRILAKARELGLEAPSAATADVYSLIFVPGFSTAERVSHIAGRGVGLDAAAAAIHDLGGSIEVASRPGQGTVFTLSLPLTLAIVRSLIVEVDRERYAVPLSHVAETVRLEAGTLHEINRQGVLMWRGSAIHVADGGRLLGTGSSRSAPRNYFVVLFAGPRRRGLLVDRLVGHQDVVVKSLDPSLGRPDVVSGATILGDGRVACILDAAGIVAQREAA